MRIKIAVACLLFAVVARADYREFANLPVDPSIESKLRHAVEATLKQYPKLTPDNIAISMVDLTKPSTIARGDYHGSVTFYPASVVKLFFMTDIYHQGKENAPDVPHALKEMITKSDNDATAFIVDVLSDTTDGAELPPKELEEFINKRGVATRWFNSMGYDVSVSAKAWSFGPYGRERQYYGPNFERRNRFTSNDVASLLLWIVRRRAVSPAASDAMMALLARPLAPPRADENQVKEYIGSALPPGSKLWSKAGWTSDVRHDAAYVELPDGRKFVIVILTRGVGAPDDTTVIPATAKNVLAEFASVAPPPPPPAP